MKLSLEETARDIWATAIRLQSSLFDPNDLRSTKGYRIYDEMQKDATVKACLLAKKFGVVQKAWKVHPAVDPEDPRYKEAENIAKFVEWTLQDMQGSVVDVLYNVLDAIAKGHSILEMNYKYLEYGPYSGKVGLQNIKSKRPELFWFELDEFLNVIKLHTTIQMNTDLDPKKFIVYSYMPHYHEPWGTSDLEAAYKHWWSKQLIIKFWNIFLEKFGMPTVKGAHPPNWPEKKKKEFLKVLANLQTESALVYPTGVEVELLEGARSGQATYGDALDWHNREIAKAILGQTLTSGEGNGAGSYSMANVHMSVLVFYLLKLKRDLEETVMLEQVIKPLVDFNFGSDLYPQFSLGDLEDKDLMSLAVFMETLITQGVIDPAETWIREWCGIPAATAETRQKLDKAMEAKAKLAELAATRPAVGGGDQKKPPLDARGAAKEKKPGQTK